MRDLLVVQGVWLDGAGVATLATRPYKTFSPIYPTPYYAPQVSPGEFIGTYEPSGTGLVIAANTIVLVPIIIPFPMTFDQLGVNVETAESAKTVRLGIYPYERGASADLIEETDAISISSTGFKFQTINLALRDGLYLMALNTNATGTAKIYQGTINSALVPEPDGTATSVSSHYTYAYTYGAMPTVLGGLTIVASNAPRILMRRKA